MMILDPFEVIRTVDRSVFDLNVLSKVNIDSQCLKQIEKHTGVIYPRDLVSVLARYNGLFLQVNDRHWPFDMIGRRFVAVYGLNGVHQLFSAPDVLKALESMKFHGLLPFMEDGSGDIYVCDRQHQIYRINKYSGRHSYVGKKSFAELFAMEHLKLERERMEHSRIIVDKRAEQECMLMILRGRELLQSNRVKEAITSFEQALEIGGVNFPPQVAVTLAEAYVRDGDLVRAIKLCSEFIRRDDFSEQTWGHSCLVIRAVALAKSGSTESAMRDLDTAIVINAQYPEPFFYRLQIFESLGMTEKAFIDRSQLLTLGLKNILGFDLSISGPDSLQFGFELGAMS